MAMSPDEMTAAPNESAEMPQGELTLNDPLMLDNTGLPQGVEWQEDDEPLPNLTSEEDQILFGDPDGVGLGRPTREVERRTAPAKVIRRLPSLQRAASAPGAPASLKAAYRLLAQRLEEELRAR